MIIYKLKAIWLILCCDLFVCTVEKNKAKRTVFANGILNIDTSIDFTSALEKDNVLPFRKKD